MPQPASNADANTSKQGSLTNIVPADSGFTADLPLTPLTLDEYNGRSKNYPDGR